MRKLLHFFAFVALTILSANTFAADVPVSGNITSNTTWTKDNIYLLTGFVYVKSGATLTIEAGTLIKGDKPSKGTLIITRGSKISAVGTECEPIVFTSNQPIGDRAPGDWGGIILLGDAPINIKDSATGLPIDGIIEGGVDNSAGDGRYGGTNANSNSGTMQYVRIEYPGIAFVLNNEINGLTFGGVGAGTTIDHIQISYSGDDSYEWFGGTVNCKNLIAFKGTDDDFDTDFGYSGHCQFLLAVRDTAYYDAAGASNSFESDNNATGSSVTPLTSSVFSNVTSIGPKSTVSFPAPSYFKRGAHIRRNSTQSIYNTIFMGWPIGEFIDGTASKANYTAGSLELKNNVWAGCGRDHEAAFDSANVPSVGNINTFYAAATGAMLADPFNATTPDVMPSAGSPVLSGASFAAANLSNPFFDNTVTYRGAFGTTNWMTCWANFDSDNTPYTSVNEISNLNNINLYPNPFTENFNINITAVASMKLNISLVDISGRIIKEVMNDNVTAGAHTYTVNTENIQSGIYFVKIQSNNQATTLKMVCNK